MKMKTAVLSLTATWACIKPSRLQMNRDSILATQVLLAGMLRCRASSARRPLDIQAGRLGNKSRSEVLRQTTLIQAPIGMAQAAFLERSLFVPLVIGARRFPARHPRRMPTLLVEVTLSTDWLSLIPIRHHQTAQVTCPASRPLLTAGHLLRRAPSMAPRATCRQLVAIKVTGTPQRLAPTASRRPHLCGAGIPKASPSAMPAVSS
jgi:hypothetical protein